MWGNVSSHLETDSCNLKPHVFLATGTVFGFMLHSVALGMLEVRDRKSELPTCLHSDQLGTFASKRVED